MPNHHHFLWQEPHWKEQAHEWIRNETTRQSIQITGEIEHSRLTPWSTLLTIPTDKGRLFFKAIEQETIYEAALTHMLAGLYPDWMPELIAIDISKGWMLVQDCGEPLRTTIRSTLDIQPWEAVITRYAEMQIGLADHVSEFLALGIPDHRPAILPSLLPQLLADEESVMIGHEKGLTSAEYKQVLDLAPRFKQICLDLSEIGLPNSLNHGDLHDANVLLKNGRTIFYDWGDATVTHPFVSLRTCFVSIEMSLKLEEYAFTPGMESLLDSYLRPWQRFAPKEALRTAYHLSKPVATVTKALAWQQSISQLEGPLRDDYSWILPELFREFLHYMKENQLQSRS